MSDRNNPSKDVSSREQNDLEKPFGKDLVIMILRIVLFAVLTYESHIFNFFLESSNNTFFVIRMV